jgi:hypothetical protein
MAPFITPARARVCSPRGTLIERLLGPEVARAASKMFLTT